jgi:hypoxanthine phosphoribosyltransferase
LRSYNKACQKDANEEYCSWEEVERLVKKIANNIKRKRNTYHAILGIANGGIIPARLMARELKVENIQLLPVRNKSIDLKEMPVLLKEKKYLIVDEIYDTGDTFVKVSDAVKKLQCDFSFLMTRHTLDMTRHTLDHKIFVGKTLNHCKWVVFPWE